MKTAFTFFIICFFVYSSFAQKAGTLDSSFGENGKVLTGYNMAQSTCLALAIQADNKIVTVGNYDSVGIDGFLILRYLPTGLLDNSFGNNGKVVINFGYDIQEARSVAIQADGKIIVAGYGEKGMFNENYDVVTARLKTNGKLDSSFGNHGKMLLDFGTDEVGNSVCLEEDGKIIIGGYYNNSDFLTIRLKTNGLLDSTFGSKGKVISSLGQLSSIVSVAVQPDGKIIVGGSKGGGSSVFAMARYNSNGSIDNSFGSNGFVYTDYGENSDAISKILIQPDQKIIAVGGTGLHFDFKHEYVAVARYKTNGNLDSSFGIYGKSTLQYIDYNAYANDAVLQSDGKIVLAGQLLSDTSTNYLLIRLKTNGKFDSSFGINGTTITSFGMSDIAYGVKIQSGDSSIIASGTSQSYNFDTIDVSLAAYNQAGVRQIIIKKIKHYAATHNNAQATSLNNVSIYPNPAQNNLYVAGLSSIKKTKLTVVDFMGNAKLQAVVNTSSYNLNITALTPGNYLLKIEMNDAVVTKKFVKE